MLGNFIKAVWHAKFHSSNTSGGVLHGSEASLGFCVIFLQVSSLGLTRSSHRALGTHIFIYLFLHIYLFKAWLPEVNVNLLN
jgi:hypothetical protein